MRSRAESEEATLRAMVAPAPVPGLRHEFVEANGLRFHVAACGDGDRLALCLHGFPECWYSWRYQLPLLWRLGYRVWAPDLRGYGETDRPPLFSHAGYHRVESRFQPGDTGRP